LNKEKTKCRTEISI